MKNISSLAALLTLACLQTSLHAQAAPAKTLPPIDPQKVEDQDDMSWADYHPVPGVDWADADRKPTQRTIKVALIAADFPDQDFVITMKKQSDIFGNPQIDPIKREDVPKFYADFWNGRSDLHHKHTVNEYWMEQSHGKIGVAFTPFGPYKMPAKSFQYGLAGYGQQNSAPPGFPAGASNVRDCDQLWHADAGQNVGNDYQLKLRIFAGYDETCVWQEFGEMKFQTRDDISPEFGNPDPTMPRWAPTRYEPWTSWKAASWLWSDSAIINGECSGSIIHEVSHAAFRIGDNNNNPYISPYRRVGSGPWDIMDRGSFNGPGGPHDRWEIPVIKGGAMPAGLMLRNKIQFGFLQPSNVVRLSRDGLAKSGPAVVTVMARTADPGDTGISGIVVQLDGTPIPLPAGTQRGRGVLAGAPGAVGRLGTGSPLPPAGMTFDHDPYVDPATNPLSEGNPDFNTYTLEVVQRIGFDSFCPDSGVLLAKNKDQPSTNGGPNAYTVFNWAIDAHPEDINKLDFKRPDGTPVMRTVADYRQLNDALFHAGTNSGSQAEWEDAPNRLHFYVIDTKKDDKGILFYTLAIRSLDGSGPQTRGLTLTAPAAPASAGTDFTPIAFSLKNTGQAADVDAATHPQDDSAYLNSDIYRLSASIDGAGWTAQLQNNFAAIKFGDSQNLPVFVSHAAGAAGTATVTLTAVSESDPTKTQTITCKVSANP